MVDGFEGILDQVMAEAQKHKKLNKDKIQKILKEEGQFTAGLNSA